MDPGAKLLELVNDRVAKGMDRYSAQAAVFRANPQLVEDWHFSGGPVRETELVSDQGVQLSTHEDPGTALLALVKANIALGLPRERAVRLAFDRHPHVATAYHEGRMIPKAKPRPMLPATRQRQLWSSQDPLRPGEVLVHKLADVAAGGGWFAVMGA